MGTRSSGDDRPVLAALFNRAFMDGLHDPAQRPTANEWEQALVKTADLVHLRGIRLAPRSVRSAVRPVGGKVELRDGQQLFLSKEEGGRFVMVQMVEGR